MELAGVSLNSARFLSNEWGPPQSLRGSNELRELAATIAAHSEWRFELISIGAGKDGMATGLSVDGLEHLLASSLTAYDAGQHGLSLIYLVSVLEELVRDTAAQHRVKGRDRSTRTIIRELAFQGIIDEITADVLDHAWDRRNAIVHGRAATEGISRDEILRITTACRALQVALGLQIA